MNPKNRLLNLFIIAFLVGVLIFSPTTNASAETESAGEILLVPDGINFVGKCVQVGNSVSDTQNGVGASVKNCQYDNTIFQGLANQTFKLIFQGATASGSFFQVQVKHSGKCLWPLNDSSADGTAIVQQACNLSRTWYLDYSLADNFYDGRITFRSTTNNKCIYKDSAGTLRLGTCGGFFKALPVGIGVRIKSKYSLKCLDVNNVGGDFQEGAGLQQWDCLGYNQTNQRWNLYADTSGRRVKLIALHSAKCAKLLSYTDGTAVRQYGCTGVETEWWNVRLVGVSQSGLVYILYVLASTPFNWGGCLDLDTYGSQAGMQTGARIQGWDCLGLSQTNQHWIFRSLAP